jgi:hypothetical protein
MTKILPDPVSLATHYLQMSFTETNLVIGNATGFIYRKGDINYLITNWHVVTGRDPRTGNCLLETLAVPDMIATSFRDPGMISPFHEERFRLYSDEQMLEPIWYEHPVHRGNVDVVAIPLRKELDDRYQLYPINALQFDASFKEWVADEAFVIGYPFSKPPRLVLPIWKRASIASEPDLDIDYLPKMLIDTATRSGLSGSPVVMQRIGLHGMEGGVMKGSEIIGRIRNFIGVYSGRIGDNEFKAQLGIVWKARVIDEIIDGKVFGKAPSAPA